MGSGTEGHHTMTNEIMAALQTALQSGMRSTDEEFVKLFQHQLRIHRMRIVPCERRTVTAQHLATMVQEGETEEVAKIFEVMTGLGGAIMMDEMPKHLTRQKLDELREKIRDLAVRAF